MGVQEKPEAMLVHALSLLRNLSVSQAHQGTVGKAVLGTTVRISSFFTQKLRLPSDGNAGLAHETQGASIHLQIADLANSVLTNLATHPANRTRFFKVSVVHVQLLSLTRRCPGVFSSHRCHPTTKSLSACGSIVQCWTLTLRGHLGRLWLRASPSYAAPRPTRIGGSRTRVRRVRSTRRS